MRAEMKIRIEIDEQLQEEEIIIRSNSLDERVQKIQNAVNEVILAQHKLVFYKGDTAYYLKLEDILFFETDGSGIQAHTKGDIYRIKYKLYELEEMLPGYFMRISKSAILNTRCIYAINRSVTSPVVVQFQDTHKQVYVSRYYYKPLKERLEEKR